MKTMAYDSIHLEQYNGKNTYHYNTPMIGLTKREYFATKAMLGLISCSEVTATANEIVRMSVIYADRLIDELNKEKESK